MLCCVTAQGATVGSATHTLSWAEMPNHAHDATDRGHSHSYSDMGRTTTDRRGDADCDVPGRCNWPWRLGGGSATTSTGTASIVVGAAGSGQPHNNMQPTAFVANLFIW